MRMTRAEAKRIALNRVARRATVKKVERRVRDGLPALVAAAAPPAPRMSRRRLKAWTEER